MGNLKHKPSRLEGFSIETAARKQFDEKNSSRTICQRNEERERVRARERKFFATLKPQLEGDLKSD